MATPRSNSDYGVQDPLHNDFWSRESFNWAGNLEEAIDHNSHVVTSQDAVSSGEPSFFFPNFGHQLTFNDSGTNSCYNM